MYFSNKGTNRQTQNATRPAGSPGDHVGHAAERSRTADRRRRGPVVGAASIKAKPPPADRASRSRRRREGGILERRQLNCGELQVVVTRDVPAFSQQRRNAAAIMEVLPISTTFGGPQNGERKVNIYLVSLLYEAPFFAADSSEGYDSEEDAVVSALAKRLEEELRAAKRGHLSCGEVLLPCGLLGRVSRDIFDQADCEPCGLRGCTLYISFDGEGGTRRLGSTKLDPYTASTFELYLTLKQSAPGWNSFLPQFLK